MISLGFHCNRLAHVDEYVLANNLDRGEFYHLNAADMEHLRERLRRNGLKMSIHCPLVKPPWYPFVATWTFLSDPDEEKRQLSLRMVAETMAAAEEFGAEYVVVHFPGPVSGEWGGTPLGEVRAIAWDSCLKLAAMCAGHGVGMHLEGFGPSGLLEPGFLREVMAKYRCFSYCFDTGHMRLSSLRDGFDMYEFARQIAPCVGSIHLWNNRGFADYERFRHIPVHPRQRPDEGWVDIRRVLETVRRERDDLVVIFESPRGYPEELGGYDYRDGVRWVREILGISS